MKYLESSSTGTGTLQRGGSSRFLKKNTSLGLSDSTSYYHPFLKTFQIKQVQIPMKL